MSNYIIIDGIEYKVRIASLKRNAEILDKYFYRTEDGSAVREVIGTFYNYTLAIGVVDDISLYNTLYDVLTAPVESHSVTLPSDGVTFDGYFASTSDEVDKIEADGTRFKGLTCSLIAMKPARYANE